MNIIVIYVPFLSYHCYPALFVPCILMVTCWECADLLDFLCVVFSCVFVSFAIGVPGQVWLVGSNNFSAQFIKIISHYKIIGYNINVLKQTACLVVNQITVGNFAFLFNCTPVGRTSDSTMVPTLRIIY